MTFLNIDFLHYNLLINRNIRKSCEIEFQPLAWLSFLKAIADSKACPKMSKDQDLILDE